MIGRLFVVGCLLVFGLGASAQTTEELVDRILLAAPSGLRADTTVIG